MKASELIGKKAIRTGPTCQGDYSTTDEPIFIIDVTDSHILYHYVAGTLMSNVCESDKVRIRNNTWLDDNWTDYNELMGIIEPDPIQKILDKLEALFEQVHRDLEKAILEC